MSTLVTLAQAKAFSRIDHADEDVGAQLWLDQAEEHVVRYLKAPDADWTESKAVQAAIVLVFAEMFEQRELADLGKLFAPPSATSPGGAVFNLLNPLRDPTLA